MLKGESPELIDEILAIVGEAEGGKLEPSYQEDETETSIKMRLLDEPDWRKRASLAAMIISKSLS